MDIEETSTIQSCLGAQSVSPRFDLKSKPDKTRKIKVVGGGERGQVVPECCKVGQVTMVLFLSTIAGRSLIRPTIRFLRW